MSHQSHKLIRASAGTGKTFQLSNRYLRLVAEGVPPDEILASTFTRKAAGEILDRVIVRLAHAARDEDACRALAGFLEDLTLDRARCQQLLQTLLGQLHRLRVGTLDSFFSQIAGSFSLELGMPLGWSIADDMLDAQLRARAIASVLRGKQDDVLRLMSLLAKGNADRSVSRLLHDTVDSLYEYYLETDEEAWKQIPRPTRLTQEQLVEALAALRGAPVPELKRWLDAVAQNIEAAEAGDWLTFLGKGLSGKIVQGEQTYYRREIPAGVVSAYQPLIRHARAVLLNELADETWATYCLLQRFDASYRQLKHEAGVLRFSDVTRHLAQDDLTNDVARLEQRLDTRVRHLLLDEFQDTSLAQWAVLRPFARRVTQALDNDSGDRSFFCVGDAKQAIYGWRGGVAEIFDALEDELTGLESEPLNRSFRSSQPVIDTVNAVFANLTQHTNLDNYSPAVERWQQDFPKHSTARTELPGYTELVVADKVEEDSQRDPTVEATAHRVAEFASQHPGRSVGVLVRKNKMVGQVIHRLRELGVQASEEGGNPLSNSVAVQLILSVLRIADHPADTIGRMHVVSSPLAPALGLTDLKDNQTATEFGRTIRRKLVDEGYGPTIYSWVRTLEASCSSRELSRLGQLVELAYSYDGNASLRPIDFVRFIEQERVSDPSSADIRVMNLHQSKGLQFDLVVLTELDARLSGQTPSCVVGQPHPTAPIDRICRYRSAEIQNLLPDELQELFARATSRTVNEALCLLYVGMTRAVHALHMIIAPVEKNERSLPKTAAGLLRASLAGGAAAQAGAVLYTHGDAHWAEKMPESRTAPEADAEAPLEPLPVELSPVVHVNRREPEVISPSSLEGGARISLANVLRTDNQAARQRGTLIHAWFEQVGWLDDSADVSGPTDAALRDVAQTLEHNPAELDQLIRSFRRMLAKPEIASVLQRAYYSALWPAGDVSCHNEHRFAVRDESGLSTGSIDRLVLHREQGAWARADIVDFKTDALDRSDPTQVLEKVEYYRPQIEAYRKAVARMYHLDRSQVTARLLFVGAGMVRPVEESVAVGES